MLDSCAFFSNIALVAVQGEHNNFDVDGTTCLCIYIYIYIRRHTHTHLLYLMQENRAFSPLSLKRRRGWGGGGKKRSLVASAKMREAKEREKAESPKKRNNLYVFSSAKLFRAIFSLLAHSLYSLFWLSSSMALLSPSLVFSSSSSSSQFFSLLLPYCATRHRQQCITCTHVRDYRRRTSGERQAKNTFDTRKEQRRPWTVRLNKFFLISRYFLSSLIVS